MLLLFSYTHLHLHHQWFCCTGPHTTIHFRKNPLQWQPTLCPSTDLRNFCCIRVVLVLVFWIRRIYKLGKICFLLPTISLFLCHATLLCQRPRVNNSCCSHHKFFSTTSTHKRGTPSLSILPFSIAICLASIAAANISALAVLTISLCTSLWTLLYFVLDIKGMSKEPKNSSDCEKPIPMEVAPISANLFVEILFSFSYYKDLLTNSCCTYYTSSKFLYLVRTFFLRLQINFVTCNQI